MNDRFNRFKFRTWNKKTQKMKKVIALIVDAGVYYSLMVNENEAVVTPCEEPHMVLMQCTSLKDKNGKLIYEGDIVNWVLPRKDKDVEENYIIVWNEKYANFTCKKRNGDIMPQIFSQPELRAKVIGNIYQNPELLEDKNAG